MHNKNVHCRARAVYKKESKCQKSLLFFVLFFIVEAMNQILTLPILDQILDTLVQDETCVTKESFHKLKNSILAQYSIKDGPTSIELLAQYEA